MAAFATVTELETATGMVGLGGRGTAILDYVSAEIRRYVGQDLEETPGRMEEHAGGMGRYFINLTQVPVTAVTSITEDGVAFTAFTWSRWGQINRDAWTTWDTGPIVVTYDSGYAPTSDEMAAVKSITIDAAWRALSPGPQETFGLEAVEQRGGPFGITLTPDEKERLDSLAKLAVG